MGRFKVLEGSWEVLKGSWRAAEGALGPGRFIVGGVLGRFKVLEGSWGGPEGSRGSWKVHEGVLRRL